MKNIKITGLLSLFLIIQISSYAQEWPLKRCLQYAQQHNKELLAQAEAVEASHHRQKASASGLFPEISGRAEMDHFWQIPVQAFPAELVGGEPGTFVPVRVSTPWTASYGAEASLSLVDPRKWQSIKLSSLQYQMQESEFYSLKQLLLKNVQMAFHQVQSLQENHQAMKQLDDSYAEIHSLMTLQFDKGLIDQITFNQSLSLRNDRREAMEKAGIELRSAYLDLKFWMGYPLHDSLLLPEKAQIPDPDLQDDEFTARLLPAYELRSLQQKQAAQQWKISRANRLPSLSAVGGFQRVAFRNSFDFFQGGDWFNVGSVGLRIHIPLLSLSQMVHEPARQKTLLKQASYQLGRYEEEQERIFQQEKMQMAQAYQVWQNQLENLKLARENESLMIMKIERGFIDMLQLRQVQDDLYRAQQKVSRARLDYLSHYVALDYLQGRQRTE